MQNPRKLLQQYGLHPKKHWGQNFLIEPNITRRIVSLLEANEESRIVELGAGTGVLTRLLCEQSNHVYAVERDRDLVAVLEQEFAGQPVQILAADAAKVNFQEIAGEEQLMVIGNLPYQISTPILFHILENRAQIQRAVLMLQREVANRLSAQQGDGKDYSMLSIRFGAYFQVTQAIEVSRKCFYPRPQVESIVVQLDPLAEPRVPNELEPWFARTVKTAFASRRKTLYNNLKANFIELTPAQILELLESLSIDPQCRGEILSIEQFAQLAQALHNLST